MNCEFCCKPVETGIKYRAKKWRGSLLFQKSSVRVALEVPRHKGVTASKTLSVVPMGITFTEFKAQKEALIESFRAVNKNTAPNARTNLHNELLLYQKHCLTLLALPCDDLTQNYTLPEIEVLLDINISIHKYPYITSTMVDEVSNTILERVILLKSRLDRYKYKERKTNDDNYLYTPTTMMNITSTDPSFWYRQAIQLSNVNHWYSLMCKFLGVEIDSTYVKRTRNSLDLMKLLQLFCIKREQRNDNKNHPEKYLAFLKQYTLFLDGDQINPVELQNACIILFDIYGNAKRELNPAQRTILQKPLSYSKIPDQATRDTATCRIIENVLIFKGILSGNVSDIDQEQKKLDTKSWHTMILKYLNIYHGTQNGLQAGARNLPYLLKKIAEVYS